MRYIDIDALNPNFPDQLIPQWEKPKRKRRSPKTDKLLSRGAWIHLEGWQRHGPGIRPDKMRRWRDLETRAFELEEAWKRASTEFWDMASSFPRPVDSDETYQVIVAVDDPSRTGEDRVLKLSESGYSVDWQSHMVGELMRKPRSHGDFTFIPYDKGGRELGLLEHKMERLLRSHGLYRAAFHRAVESRLENLSDSRRISSGRYYLKPAVFLVENEGRVHVISSGTNGGFSWQEGEVMTTVKDFQR